MNGTRSTIGWPARILIAFVLMLAGAAATIWSLAHYRPAARFLGVLPTASPVGVPPKPPLLAQTPPQPLPLPASADQRITVLEQRLSKVEDATHRAEGSAGRADALVVAFAARRAIDRGVALGYLETLLTQRFGGQHAAAVATIITASHRPVRLNELVDQYQGLGSDLRRGGPQDSWWTSIRRELGSIAEVHRASQPPVNPEARYQRALQRLGTGDVDQALAETMRLPGAAAAAPWTDKARRYVAVHRALDEIESAALLPAADANG